MSPVPTSISINDQDHLPIPQTGAHPSAHPISYPGCKQSSTEAEKGEVWEKDPLVFVSEGGVKFLETGGMPERARGAPCEKSIRKSLERIKTTVKSSLEKQETAEPREGEQARL